MKNDGKRFVDDGDDDYDDDDDVDDVDVDEVVVGDDYDDDGDDDAVLELVLVEVVRVNVRILKNNTACGRDR